MKPESLYYQNQTKLLEESKTTDLSHQQRYKTQHEQTAFNNVKIYIYHDHLGLFQYASLVQQSKINQYNPNVHCKMSG